MTCASTVRSVPSNVGFVPTEIAEGIISPWACSQPAYTPSAGIAVCGRVSTFAVGTPNSRPRWAPRTTTPSTRCGRPRISIAPSTSPSPTSRRVRVEAVSYTGRGERLAAARLAGHEQVDDLDLEVVRLAQLGQEHDVTRRTVAEAEVRALDDGLGAQLVDEDLHDEVRRGEVGELRGEREDQDRVHAQVRHEFGPPVVRGQQGRMGARAQHLLGVRVEGDDHRGQAQFAGAVHGVLNDELVSAVDTVVGTDGDDAAPPVLGDVLQATPALHCDRSLSNPCPSLPSTQV